jgi:hypothetical protein
MFRRPRSTCAALAAVGVLLLSGLVTSHAQAQSDEEARAAARQLGIEGIRLAKDGKCDVAIDKLDRANRLFHAPTIVVQLGECQILMGRLVEGTEKLNSIVREELGPNPNPAYQQAQERARKLLDSTMPRIPTLTVDVTAPAGSKLLLTVDGRTMSDALVGVPRPIDPGKHLIVAKVEGYEPAQSEVVLAEGAKEQTSLVIERPLPATVVAPLSAPAQPGQAPAASPSGSGDNAQASEGGSQRTWGWVALGAGGVGVLAGSYFGLSALSDKSDLTDACSDGRCPPEQRSTIDSMNSSALVSTVGFGVGLVGLGVGSYLLLTAPSAGSASADRGAQASITVTPYVSPSSAGVVGSF